MRDPQSLSLLSAVAENPDDLAVRLVYADRMEEIGNADRAEFIRVQIRLAELGTPRCERTGVELNVWGKVMTPRCRCTVCKLKRREYLSSRSHIGVGDWLVTSDFWSFFTTDDWHRGFPECVTMACLQWWAAGPELVKTYPIRQLWLTDSSSTSAASLWPTDPPQASAEARAQAALHWARGQAGMVPGVPTVAS
jgi:uncharacterized protein (TIGR02996 family)